MLVILATALLLSMPRPNHVVALMPVLVCFGVAPVFHGYVSAYQHYASYQWVYRVGCPIRHQCAAFDVHAEDFPNRVLFEVGFLRGKNKQNNPAKKLN